MSRPLISDISNISSVVVGMVLHMLDSPIRQQDTVAALHIAIAVISLVGINVGPAVVIMDSILVMVGVWGLLVVRCWGMVNRSRGRGVVDRRQDWHKPSITQYNIDNCHHQHADQRHGLKHDWDSQEWLFASSLYSRPAW